MSLSQLPKTVLFQCLQVRAPVGIDASFKKVQQIAIAVKPDVLKHDISTTWNDMGKPHWTKSRLLGIGGWFCSIDFRLISTCHLQPLLLLKLHLSYHRVTSRGYSYPLLREQVTLVSTIWEQDPHWLMPWLKSQPCHCQRGFLWDSLPIKWETKPNQVSDFFFVLYCFVLFCFVLLGRECQWI